MMRWMLCLLLATGALMAADRTWDGGSGANDNWTTNQNWGDNDEPNGATDGATMAGAVRPNPVLDAAITLNRLTFSTATAFNLGGAGPLILGGTDPLIEVLQGAHTISAPFTVNGALTIYVASGATLTISATAINGTGALAKIGPGTLNLSDVTAPTVPAFSSPAELALTNDTTPTWTWASGGGGNGTFRVTLGGGTPVLTTSTSFTPGTPLSNGTHALTVEERDVRGNWSATATRQVIVDGTPPTIVSRITRDLNADGRLDAVEVTFSEAMQAVAGTWTVAGYAVGGPVWVSPTLLRLPLTPQASPDTGILPAVAYTAGAAADVAGNLLATGNLAATDGAAPVIVEATATFGTSSLTVRFSEPVVTTSTGAGNLVAGDFVLNPANPVVAFADANGLDGTVVLTLQNAVNDGATVRAVAGEIFDLAGNAAGIATRAITQPLVARETASAGPWTNGATWVGGIIPGFDDHVVIQHAVTLTQHDFRDVRSLTFRSGGSLSADDVPVGSYTILNLIDYLIIAEADASVTNVQFYDGFNNVDTIFRVSTGATLTLNNTNQGHFVRRVVKEGGGRLVWNSPANNFSGGGQYDVGPTRIDAGVFELNVPNGRPAGFEWQVAGSAALDLRTDQTINLLTGQGTIRREAVGTSTLTLNSSSWSGSIVTGTGNLAVTLPGGGHTWSGANTFTGGLAISGGTLTINGSNVLADAGAVVVNAPGTLIVEAAETVGRLDGTGTVQLNADLTVNQGAFLTTFSGGLAGTGRLSVQGTSGRLTLTGNNTHGGTTLLTGGTVEVGSNTALGTGAGPLILGGGTLRLSNHLNLTGDLVQTNPLGDGPSTAIPAQGATLRPVSVTAGGTLHLGAFSLALPGFDTAVGQDLTIVGNATAAFNVVDPALFVVTAGDHTWAGRLLAGTAFGFLCKQGPGSLAITNGTNTWSKRVVRAEAGTLAMGASGCLGPVGDWVFILPSATGRLPGVTYTSAPLLYLSGTLSAGGTSAWQGQVDLWSATPTILVDAAAQFTLSGVVSSTTATSLTKSGTGTLVMGAANTFTLPLSVTGGTVVAAADNRLGNAGNLVTLHGGTLSVPTGFAATRTFSIGAGNGTIEVASGQTLSLSGAIGGAGQLRKTGAGQLSVSGVANQTGGTRVDAGRLAIVDSANLGAVGATLTLDGGTLVASATVLPASRLVTLGGGGGVIETAAGVLDVEGVVSGGGALTKTGVGTLALSATNTFTGPVSVQEGTLSAREAAALGTTAAGTIVAEGSVLELSGSFTSAEPLQLAGAGTGSGVLTSVSGDQTLSGAITLVRVAAPATVNVAAGQSLILAGAIAGQGGLAKLGEGLLTLGVANGFDGQVTVGAGVLAIAADNRLGLSANEVLLSGGTLRALAALAAPTRIIRIGSGGGTLDTTGAGHLITLPGLDSASGQDLVLAGTGTVQMAVTGGAVRTLAGQVGGTATLGKSGAGTLAINSPDNTLTGAAAISGGTLLVSGTLPGAVTIGAGATVAGTGSVGNLSVQPGGVVSPAGDGAAGVLTVLGDLNLSGAELRFNLGGVNDLLAVGGTATTDAGQPSAVVIPPSGAFIDGVYPLINAAVAGYATGGVTVPTLPAGAQYALAVSGGQLQLIRDAVAPTLASITSPDFDGEYIAGDDITISLVFSEPVALNGSIEVTLNTTPERTVTISGGATRTTTWNGIYSVIPGDQTADLNVTTITFTPASSVMDIAGNETTTLVLPVAGQNLGGLKNIAIVNRAPQVDINSAGVGATTPPAFDAGAPGSTVVWTATGPAPANELLVQAVDLEGAADADLVWTLRLDPGQGQLQRFDIGTNSWVAVQTDPPSASTFTQADVVAGRIRYRHTSTVGGNDAVLIDCADPQGNTSPLFLVRFAIAGDGPPVVSDFTDALTFFEPADKPGAYAAIDGDVSVTDDSDSFAGGNLILTVLNGAAGLDQLDVIAPASVSGSTVSVGGTVLGTISGRGTTELSVAFAASAGPTSTGALLRAIGYRYTGQAPTNGVGRALRLRITDGSAGGGITEAVKPVSIDPWNDPPTVAGADIATVPGLERSGTLTPSDPEGLDPALITMAVVENPTRGTLQFTPATGAYTYTPGFLPATAAGEVVLDRFTISATDTTFAGDDPRRMPSADAARTVARTGERTITVRITNGGATGLAFINAPRMTVQAGGIFVFEPQVRSPAGASLTYELLGDPGVTAFSPTTGVINWNPVTAPAGGTPGYHRFGLLVTDTVSGTSALLPIMLRVGPGGSG